MFGDLVSVGLLSGGLLAAASSTPGNIAYVLAAALAAALGGGAVAWRRLSVLGESERGKLVAEKDNIISEAESRATSRSLEALTLALKVTEQQRDEAKHEITVLRSRVETLERNFELRLQTLTVGYQAGVTALEASQAEVERNRKRLIEMEAELTARIDTVEANGVGATGAQGETGEKGEKGEKGEQGEK